MATQTQATWIMRVRLLICLLTQLAKTGVVGVAGDTAGLWLA